MRRPARLTEIVAVMLPLCLALPESGGEDWPRFRGAHGTGSVASTGLPETWSATENIRWHVPIPGRGWSSPIVSGQQVFLTTAINTGEDEEARKGLYFGGDRPQPPDTVHLWKVIALDLRTGALLWERVVHQGQVQHGIHIKNSRASETPVTDGRYLYAYFGNVGIFCYDRDGTLRWSKSLAPVNTRFSWGTAASPVLHQGKLYLVNDNEDESYLVAFDAESGEELWRTMRDEKSNWATPFVWEQPQRTEIVVPGTNKTRAYDLDGQLLYEFGGASSITIATPYAAHDLLYVSSGYVLDRRKPLFAVRPGSYRGDVTLASDESSNSAIAWCQPMAAPYNPTSIVYGDQLYVLLDRGFLASYDARTGAVIYGPQRIPRGRAFTSSPWAYQNKVFALNEDGETFVFQAGTEFNLLHVNPLGDDEMAMATPAIAGDTLLIRTAQQLYAVGSP